ncbi:uncharacterized protein I206_106342 [Kwoniella pini CBS 10737]|uniref:Uncharacterized protein n=1 Tax=Kwoniella pini CBS 10737 TaxID=1296096 RepID=A0A1B9HU14_9TREE|nr:uncharacterized protein I206_07144 [Kwoniella pini CBS 10737]OCF46757.1 hypothetical protein I206_07144 [Kwoniella pini CBS 10737]
MVEPTNYHPSSPSSISVPPLSPRQSRNRNTSSPRNNVRSPKIQSSPILLQPLPATSSLNKESIYASELELDKQTKQLNREKQLSEALKDQLYSIEREKIKIEQGTWSKNNSKFEYKDKDDKIIYSSENSKTKPFNNPPQAFELYKAIDDHNFEFIMRIRDYQFDTLLQKNGNEFPILYATRLGNQWRDVVILLVGALSRYVNHLEPEDFEKKETLRTLKALRANLKLAIDHTLINLPPGHSTNLLSSYLQVLIMSEGDSFLLKSMNEISLIIRSKINSSNSNSNSNSNSKLNSEIIKPVFQSENIIRKFCTKELRGIKEGIIDVEEYISNATLDLLILSCWNLVSNQLNIENLPTHTFARDLRTYSLFIEAYENNLTNLNKLNPKLKKILNILIDLAGDSKKSVKGRLEDVRNVLDT